VSPAVCYLRLQQFHHGFAVDEPQEHLGEHLMLPRHYEAERATFERILPPVTLPNAHSKVIR
jgi:glyoxalase family protein